MGNRQEGLFLIPMSVPTVKNRSAKPRSLEVGLPDSAVPGCISHVSALITEWISAGVNASDSNPSRPSSLINTIHCKYKKIKGVAERVGFEPTVGVNLHTLSKRAP